MAAHNELGKWGEDCAADYLQHLGYTIVARDWKSGHRDIDIIAMDEETMVFVEVKTRRNRAYIEPETAVDYRKLRNLQGAINHYVKYYRVNHDIRFDIITVVGTMDDVQPEIEHLKDIPLY
jgi:putative endonuclease